MITVVKFENASKYDFHYACNEKNTTVIRYDSPSYMIPAADHNNNNQNYHNCRRPE